LESKGAKDKGIALLDGVKSRLLTSIQGTGTDDDNSSPFSTQSLAKRIDSNLVTMLSKWKTSSSGNEVMLQTQLTRLTSLLSLVSEGQLTLHDASISSGDIITSRLGSGDLKSTGKTLAREQLTRTLVRVKHTQEGISGEMSGRQFFKQFRLEGASGSSGGSGGSSIFTAAVFQDTWKEASKLTSSKFK